MLVPTHSPALLPSMRPAQAATPRACPRSFVSKYLCGETTCVDNSVVGVGGGVGGGGRECKWGKG